MKDIIKLLNGMTIEEKIGQLTQYNAIMYVDSTATITGDMSSLKLTEEDLKTVGNILNFSSPTEMRTIQERHLKDDRNKIPMLFMMDVVHGFRTIYPIPLALGCSFNTDIVAECCKMAAKEAVAGGVQVTFAPMVDYVRDARWGRVMESCGEDPYLNGIMGATQVKAFQGENLEDKNSIAVCIKHFAADGGAEAGRDYNNAEISEHTLREYYLPAYKACIDAGAYMIMPSFNVVNGLPATANKWLMQHILKDEWNFDGIVISDYGAVKEFIDHGIAENEKECAEIAFKNNCDIEMCSSAYIHHLKELVEEGTISKEALDDAVLKVLKLKDKLGMFEDPFRNASIDDGSTIWLTEENRDIARRAAEESAVLLKNESILPFSKDIHSIALIGPFADSKEIIGFWACNGRNEDSITVKEGIEKTFPHISISVEKGWGYEWDDCNSDGFSKAIEIAKESEAVVLCLGEPQDYSGEGNSRADISLHKIQLELAKAVIEVNHNVAVLTFSGRPIVLTEIANIAPAILHMWFPGTEGGSAAATLLFGYANPSGKLSMSFPEITGQCPIYYNHTNIIKNGKQGAHNPYTSSYIECANTPLFSFGHGLSYSNFVYEELEVSDEGDDIKVFVTVYNDSNLSGKETVMVYMRDVVASVARPCQQLIGFKKVEFKAFERNRIEFVIEKKDLGFWNSDNNYIFESGEFQFSTGHADHLILTKSIYLADIEK